MKTPSLLLALFLSALSGSPRAQPLPSLDPFMRSSASRSLFASLEREEARRSIRGSRELWTQLNLQVPDADKDPALASLEADLRLTDLEGQLREAGLRLLPAKKTSLALGLRPTLVLTVQFVPKGSEGNEQGFYWVMAEALQDVTPLGGEVVTLPTWAMLSDPVPGTGDLAQDISVVRAAARACVKGFITAAKEKN
jgi:hypothetical protein